MDGIKGIHAFFTFFLIMGFAYFGYGFASSFFDGMHNDLLKYIYYGTYIIIVVVCGVIVPLLIAMAPMGENSDANIISSVTGFGIYFMGVILMSILDPIINFFIDMQTAPMYVINGAGQQILDSSSQQLNVGILSILYIVAVLLALVILPVVIATMPSLTEKTITGGTTA